MFLIAVFSKKYNSYFVHRSSKYNCANCYKIWTICVPDFWEVVLSCLHINSIRKHSFFVILKIFLNSCTKMLFNFWSLYLRCFYTPWLIFIIPCGLFNTSLQADVVSEDKMSHYIFKVLTNFIGWRHVSWPIGIEIEWELKPENDLFIHKL